jgi:hypothetical protein
VTGPPAARTDRKRSSWRRQSASADFGTEPQPRAIAGMSIGIVDSQEHTIIVGPVVFSWAAMSSPHCRSRRLFFGALACI